MDVKETLEYCQENMDILKEILPETEVIDREQNIVNAISEAGVDEKSIEASTESCDIVAEILNDKINAELLKQSADILKKIKDIAEN